MGYKAEIKRLTNILEVKKKQTDILYAALKMIVRQEGLYSKGENGVEKFIIELPQFEPEEINKHYTITTEPVEGETPEEDRLVMTVTENNKEE